VLLRLAAGEAIGTRLVAESLTLAAKKTWLAGHLKTSGRLTLDAGATRALLRDGKSLLPVGVTHVEGTFERGEVVSCISPEGHEIARGLSNYSALEAARIAKKPTAEIEAALGYIAETEIIHRDNLVVL
jgi:glutamate 5-kinase